MRGTKKVMEHCILQMAIYIKVISKITKERGKENLFTRMVMFIVGVLKIIKKKVKENLFIQMGMDLT